MVEPNVRVGNEAHPPAEGIKMPDSDQFVEAVTAAIPPGMQRNQQMSPDDLLAEMNRVPLFMTSLDETDGEGGENIMLEAIKAIAYEGTKAEVATNFREQGNEAARAKLWKDAREFYTKAIATLRGQVKTNASPDDPTTKVIEEVDEEAETKKQREIAEACLTNRALCNLEMKNYGSCNRDCAAALRLNSANVKAWYRAASACLALDKIPEAKDACDSGLAFDRENAALRSLLTNVERREHHLAAQIRAREEREQRSRDEAAVFRRALHDRQILSRKTDSPPEMEDAEMSLADPADSTSTLSFPVLLLYPLDAQTDLIKAFREDEKLSEHLEYILPVPWDEKHHYTPENVECYMETVQGGLIKAGKKLTLLKLLSSGKVEVVDGLLRVYVVPKDRAAEWIERFKARQGKR